MGGTAAVESIGDAKTRKLSALRIIRVSGLGSSGDQIETLVHRGRTSKFPGRLYGERAKRCSIAHDKPRKKNICYSARKTDRENVPFLHEPTPILPHRRRRGGMTHTNNQTNLRRRFFDKKRTWLVPSHASIQQEEEVLYK